LIFVCFFSGSTENKPRKNMSDDQVNEPTPDAPAEESVQESAPKSSCCSGGCPCDMITKPFEDSPFFAKAKEIFLWKDVMKSLVVFCVVNVIFILLLCYEFTLLGLICWVFFFALLAAICFDFMHILAYFKGEDNKSQLADKNFEFPAEYIDGFFKLAGDVFKAFLAVCVNAVLIRSVPFSLGMVFGFLFLIYLAGHMGICGMLYGALLFCFIWFRLYRDYKDAIDNLFAKAKEFVRKQIEQLKEKINKPKAQ